MNQREASRREWTTDDAARATQQEIDGGSLARIADAVEKMAASYDDMRKQRDHWERIATARYNDWQRAERSIRSLRGVITKLKRAVSERSR